MRTKNYANVPTVNERFYDSDEARWRTQSSAKDFLFRSSRVMAERIMEDAEDPVKATAKWFGIDKIDFAALKAAAKKAVEADCEFDILMAYAQNVALANGCDPMKEVASQFCMTEEEVEKLVQEAYK